MKLSISCNMSYYLLSSFTYLLAETKQSENLKGFYFKTSEQEVIIEFCAFILTPVVSPHFLSVF